MHGYFHKITATAVWLGVVLSAPAQSLRPGMGATLYADAAGTGATFRTWAPNASSVNVAGTFNGWSTSAHPMTAEPDGFWSCDVDGVVPDDRYKYVINGTLWRRDPYSRQIATSGSRNSVVVDTTAFDWGGEKTMTLPAQNALVIYEMHIGTFFDPLPGDGQVGQFTDAMTKLDALVHLGVNAVQLMPVSAFATTTSWGYNPSYPFAIEASYGTPDELKAFVKACHERGLAVVMDVVYNHWGPDANDWSLWQFDGWSGTGSGGGIYFFEEAGLCCSPWGPRPNYLAPAMQAYLRDHLFMWLREYRVDGFRWDAPKYILYVDSARTQPVDGAAELVELMLAGVAAEFPGTLQIAEDQAGWPGFDGHWDFGFERAVRTVLAAADDARDMNSLAAAISGSAQRVIYSESHDTTGNLNNGRRLPVVFDSVDPEGWSARKRTGLAAVFTLTAPGIPMIWQGQEMLATNVFGSTRPLDWSRTNTFAATTRLYRDLIRLRRNLGGVSAGLSGSGCAVTMLDHEAKLIGFRRFDEQWPGHEVFVLANLRDQIRVDEPVLFPAAGRWYVHLNTDHSAYGADYGDAGPLIVEATGEPPTAPVTIGPYSALIMSQTPFMSVPGEAEHEVDTDGDGLSDGWEWLYFGSITGAVAHADSDGDGMTNAEEFLAGTDPLDPSSYFRMTIHADETGRVALRWNSAPGRTYRLWRRSDLSEAFGQIMNTNVPATPAMNTKIDESPSSGDRSFYRVELE